MHTLTVRACRMAAFALSAAVALAAILVLAGRFFSIESLTTLGAGGIAMRPMTALCLLLLATALLALLPTPAPPVELWAGRVAAGGALAVAITRVTSVERAVLMLVALSVLLLDVEVRRRRVAQIPLLLSLPLTLLLGLGFVFRVSDLYGWGAILPMARLTGYSLVALQIAVLAGRIEHGVTRVLVATGAGGVTARRLLPAAILLPIAVGFLRLAGEQRGYYGAAFGVLLFTLAMIVVLSALVWWTACSVDRVEKQRAEADARLKALIRHSPLGIVVLDLEGRVQLCNQAFTELFHYPETMLIGRKVDDFIAPRQDGGETERMTQRGVAGEAVRQATVRRRRDGTLVHVELFVVPLLVNGRPAGTYGMYRDLQQTSTP